MSWLRNILGLNGNKRDEEPKPVGPDKPTPSNSEVWSPYGLERAISLFDGSHLKTTSFDELYASWRWFEIRPAHVEQWSNFDSVIARRSLCIAAMNSSGFVREAAVRVLAAHPHPESLPFLIWSLRDWVMQVRDAALKGLRNYMTPELAAAFVQHHGLIDRLDKLGRVDLSDVVREIRSYLTSAEAAPALSAVLQSDDAPLRAFVFRLREAELPSDVQLQQLAAKDSEPSIRGWFASQTIRFEPEQRRSWQSLLIRDKSALVARRVIWSLDPEGRERLRDELIEATCSPARPVREAARCAVPDMAKDDFASLYRQRLASADGPDSVAGLVGGLSETGTQVDVDRLSSFTNSTRSRVRFEAIRGLVRVDRVVASAVLLDHLADTNGRIRRLVSSSLSSDISDNELAYLHEVMSKDNDVLATATAMRALTSRGSWDTIPAILLGAASRHESLRDEAWERGWTWMRKYAAKGWIKPSSKIRPHLEMALARFRAQGHQPDTNYEECWNELLNWTASALG